MWFPARVAGGLSDKSITAEANSSNRSSILNFRPPVPPSPDIQASSPVSFGVRCWMLAVGCWPFFMALLRFFLPTGHQLLRHTQMVEDTSDDRVHHLFDRLWNR